MTNKFKLTKRMIEVINEVLEQGYIYIPFSHSDTEGEVIKQASVYALTIKRNLLPYFETDCGDYLVDDYNSDWWTDMPDLQKGEVPENVLELSRSIVNSKIEVNHVDRLYWQAEDSAVNQLAAYLIKQGWHK